VITPRDAVDAANERFGRHAGCRALHARGLLFAGTFTATPAAARLTRAPHMQGAPVRATVRFSNGGGDPDVPDHVPDVRGMAVKLYLPDGATTDISAQTAPRFPVRTPEGFADFMRAMSGGVAVAWKLPLFLARHREAITALPGTIAGIKTPASYATRHYYAIHSYRFVDAAGGERHVRYRWVPEAGEETISSAEGKRRGPRFLQEEIVERVAREAVRFALEVQIAAPGDPVDDTTAPWRSDRETPVVGWLELTGVETGRERDGDVLVFDPCRITDGIALSGDPVLRYRTSAYSVSVERRSGVPRGAEAPDTP
jgi:catalase